MAEERNSIPESVVWYTWLSGHLLPITIELSYKRHALPQALRIDVSRIIISTAYTVARPIQVLTHLVTERLRQSRKNIILVKVVETFSTENC